MNKFVLFIQNNFEKQANTSTDLTRSMCKSSLRALSAVVPRGALTHVPLVRSRFDTLPSRVSRVPPPAPLCVPLPPPHPLPRPFTAAGDLYGGSVCSLPEGKFQSF